MLGGTARHANGHISHPTFRAARGYSRIGSDCRCLSHATCQAVSHRIHRRCVSVVVDARLLLLAGDSHAPESRSVAHIHRRARFPSTTDYTRLDCNRVFRHFIAGQYFCMACCLSALFVDSALESLPLLFGSICSRVSFMLRRDVACAVTVFVLVVGLRCVAAPCAAANRRSAG